jgi:hypothetical protein
MLTRALRLAMENYKGRHVKALSFPVWYLSSFLGGVSPLGEAAIYLAKKIPPDDELLQPVHYRQRWQGIPDEIGLATAR